MPNEPREDGAWDRAISGVLGAMVGRCRELEAEGGIPREEMPVLVRRGVTLAPGSAPEIVWRRLTAKLGRAPEVWEAALAAVDRLRADEQIEADIGFVEETSMRADLFLKGPLEQFLRHYHQDHSGWDWNEEEALGLIASWREGERIGGRMRRTLAPLHNFRSMAEMIEIEPGLSVRRLGDEDRARLWRLYGAERPQAPREVTISQLEAWEFAIELRWRAETQPLDDNEAIRRIEDLVRALRLHHSGHFGTTMIWSGPDPEDPWGGDHCGDALTMPVLTAPLAFHGRMPGDLGPGCPPRLRALLRALGDVRENRRLSLVLGRFDSAYERLGPEDRLIDLWIAFEALFLSDTRGELSYRAALRIAQLVGEDGTSRRAAFDLARESYDRRSDIVHGTFVAPGELERVAESTRLLAVDALRAWLLNPPEGGARGLDYGLLG